MKNLSIVALAIACPAAAWGQDAATGTATAAPKAVAQQPILSGGGYGYTNAAAQTAEGAALQGMSQVISAAGQYNLGTSAAAINMTQAQSNEMRNLLQAVQTFYQMRELGRAEREKERGPRLTPEELARLARAAAPRDLTSEQIDRVTGELRWPGPLLDPSFEDQRIAVDECAARWAKYGTLDYTERTQVRENVDSMVQGLKSQIKTIRPQEYVASRAFLQSLLYATTRSTF